MNQGLGGPIMMERQDHHQHQQPISESQGENGFTCLFSLGKGCAMSPRMSTNGVPPYDPRYPYNNPLHPSMAAPATPRNIMNVTNSYDREKRAYEAQNSGHYQHQHQLQLQQQQPQHRGRKPPQGGLNRPVAMPSSSEMSNLAFTALQLLQVPILVLSSGKVVVLANEAMAMLLGDEGAGDDVNEGQQQRSAMDKLCGKTLSEVGVEVLDDEYRDWTELLDAIALSLKDYAEFNPELDGKSPARSLPPCVSMEPHGAVVNVLLTNGGYSPMIQVDARVTVIAWPCKAETYFTLTFSNINYGSKDLMSQKRSKSRGSTTPTVGTTLQYTQNLQPGVPQQQQTVLALTHSVAMTQNIFNNWTDAPLAYESHTDSATVRTISAYDKISKMKDAIMDLMELPVFVMWADGTLVFPNRAGAELLKRAVKKCSPMEHAPNIIGCFETWSEDFTRKLEADEHPVVRICRAKENFSSMKVGVKDILGNQKVFDVGGQVITDDIMGEFLAGLCWLRDVTEFKEKLDAQKAADDQRFMAICNGMPQLIWTATPDGYVDWWSNRWYDFTGLSKGESLGLSWEICVHPNDLGKILERWRQSRLTGQEFSIEYRIRRKDGKYRWMLVWGLPLRDPATNQVLKWFGSYTDIDDSVQARLEARKTREQLTNVMTHATLTLWTIDRNYKVSMVEGDQIWESKPGDSESAFIGKSIYEIVAKEEHPQFYEPLEGILSGKIKEETYAEYYMNGKCLRTTYVPILGEEGIAGRYNEHLVTGVIGVCVDITERMNTMQELEVRERENQVLLANERAANEASKLKSVFLASMSHEIRTPIAGVIGMADLLLDTPLQAEQKEFVRSIQSSANGLLCVINDILDFSKVESGKMEIESVEFNLLLIVSDVVKMLTFEAEKKKLDFQQNIRLPCVQHPEEEQTHSRVMGDPGRLRQVLTNLIANSIKFTRKGYVRLSTGVEDEDDEIIVIKFVVEDTGIGIDESKQYRLFHPFTQADSSTARRFGGTGLGLSISKNLVELMGGSIGLTSKPGAGTTVWFTIPFNKPGASALSRSGSISSNASLESFDAHVREFEILSQRRGSVAQVPQQQLLEQPPVLRRQSSHRVRRSNTISSTVSGPTPPAIPTADRESIHVLVVEDNEVNQQIATRVIRKLKFSVSAVSNGLEALQFLRSSFAGEMGMMSGGGTIKVSNRQGEFNIKTKPDIILMDVHMPEMDGYQATQIIRSGDIDAGLEIHGLCTRIRATGKLKKDESEWLRRLPIVALTASAIRGDDDKCRRAGMDDYLPKPVSRADLEKMLLKWIGTSSTAAEEMDKIRAEMAAKANGGDSPEQGKVEEEDDDVTPKPSPAPRINSAGKLSGSDPTQRMEIKSTSQVSTPRPVHVRPSKPPAAVMEGLFEKLGDPSLNPEER